MLKEIELNLSLFPVPALSISTGIPIKKIFILIDKLVGSFMSSHNNKEQLAKLISWSLENILADQYVEGYKSGAWGRRYPEYLRILYGGEEDFPSSISIRDSITLSAWICEAITQYIDYCDNPDLTIALRSRIDAYQKYLFRHVNPENGGFGISQMDSTGSHPINSDLRHTSWALISLDAIDDWSDDTVSVFQNACIYISKKIESLNFHKEPAITNAALHKALSNSRIASIVAPDKNLIDNYKQRIELALINSYDKRHNCWDWKDSYEDSHLESSEIDDCLSMLYTIDIECIIESDLREILVFALNTLVKNCIEDKNKVSAGIPFFIKGKLDLGTTIQLIYSIKKLEKINKIDKKLLPMLMNFISDNDARTNNIHFSYSWQLASILLLAEI